MMREKNQDCKKTFFPLAKTCRDRRRSKVVQDARTFHQVARLPRIPKDMITFLERNHERNGAAMRLLAELLRFAAAGKPFFKGTETIAREYGIRPDSVSRITGQLTALGLIRKWHRGIRRAPLLMVNPLFSHPIVQYQLRRMVPHIYRAVFGFLISTGFGIELLLCQPEVLKKYEIDVPIISNGSNANYNIFNEVIKKRTAEMCVEKESMRDEGRIPESPQETYRQRSIVQPVADGIQSWVQAHGVDRKEPYTSIQDVNIQQDSTPMTIAQQINSHKGIQKQTPVVSRELPCKEIVHQFGFLRMTPFGKMKLSVFDTGILLKAITKINKDGDLYEPVAKVRGPISYDKLVAFCIAWSKELGLVVPWSRFYDACDRFRIKARKEPTTLPEEVKVRYAKEQADAVHKACQEQQAKVAAEDPNQRQAIINACMERINRL